MAERNQQPDPKLVYFTETAELRSGGTSSKENVGRHITEWWEVDSSHGQKPVPSVDAQVCPALAVHLSREDLFALRPMG